MGARNLTGLLILCFLAVCQAQEGPVWTWQCINDRCEKLSAAGAEQLQPLAVCKVLCDPNAMLWPLPRGTFEWDRNFVPLNPYSMYVESEAETRMTPDVSKLITETRSLLSQQLLSRAGLDWRNGETRNTEFAQANSLVFYIKIRDQSVTRLKADTSESYELTIQQIPDGQVRANITADTFFGIRHAFETLNQLIVFDEYAGLLKIIRSARVVDSPAYPHRGLILDTARNFISIDALKRTIDGMAASKLNTFHWHITDSQSFPMQTTTYPNFTKYGAHSPRKIYSVQQMVDLVEYANTRGVRVVPEFDAPAHVGEGWQWVPNNATVCFKAEPWTQYCVEPPCGQLNPTSETMYQYLEGIYRDMLNVFQPDMFHMGGDEVNINCWNSSKLITDWMTASNIPLTKDGFMQLWNIFQSRAYNIIKSAYGKDIPIVLWTSGLTEKGHVDQYLDKDRYIIQIWTKGNDELIAELIQKGYRVIFSNYDALYFDCGFGAWIGTGQNWCSPYIEWQRVYDNDPLVLLKNLGVDFIKYPNAASQILGSEAALWTEQTDEASLDSHFWPRAAAMAERMWSSPPGNWQTAEYRILHHRKRLLELGLKPDRLQPEWCYQNQAYCHA